MSTTFHVDFIADCAQKVLTRFPGNDSVEKALILLMVGLYGVTYSDEQLALALQLVHDESLTPEESYQKAKAAGLTHQHLTGA
jgi:hypothetical protein